MPVTTFLQTIISFPSNYKGLKFLFYKIFVLLYVNLNLNVLRATNVFKSKIDNVRQALDSENFKRNPCLYQSYYVTPLSFLALSYCYSFYRVRTQSLFSHTGLYIVLTPFSDEISGSVRNVFLTIHFDFKIHVS